jgi:hypothetical protein
MKKIIRVPSAITLMNRDTGATGEHVTFHKFVRTALLAGQRFSTDYAGLASAVAIDKALDDAPNKAAVPLDLADWDRLSAEAKASTCQYGGIPPLALQQLLPYIEAIIGAQDA